MATGSNLSRTLEGGHEPFYDFACSLCDGEGRHVQACRYCEECLVYMCEPCIRNHNKFPLNKRHQLLDQSQFTTVNKSAIVSFPTKRCPKHYGELINVFCGDHDAVCCSVCKAFEHSTCIDTKHLPDAAKDILTSQEYQSIKRETKALISDVDEVLDSKKADISRIGKEKQHVKQTIAGFRRKVNTYFDDLEQKSLDELDVKEKLIMSEINADMKHLEAMKKETEDTLKQLESFKGDNECDLFVHVKTGKQFVMVAAQKVQEISETEQRPPIQFEINEDIERYLSSLSNLGLYIDTLAVKLKQSSLDTKVAASDQSAHVSPPQSFSPGRFVKYKTQLFGRFNVKDKSDPETCFIKSICQLPDGNVLIADKKNSKIKRLDQSYKNLECVQMLDTIDSVCPAGPGQIAVSLTFKGLIQLVSVGQILDIATSFTVDTICRGMSYVGGKLLICCGDLLHLPSSRCVKVYISNGQQQYSIPPSPMHLTSVPLYITTSDDGNTVVQISPKHKKIDVILTQADGIKHPSGICFDRKQSRLLVGLLKSNDIHVFSVK